MTQNDEEHKAFIKLGESMSLDMSMHPLHLLYLSEETATFLKVFKAGYSAKKKDKKYDELLEQVEMLRSLEDSYDTKEDVMAQVFLKLNLLCDD